MHNCLQEEEASSKETMKRKIAELMDVNKKCRNVSSKGPIRPILNFRDSEKIMGIPNDIFPLQSL